MNIIPTLRELQHAGIDAGAVLDACEAELTRAVPMAASESDQCDLVEDIDRVRRLREEWFGGEA